MSRHHHADRARWERVRLAVLDRDDWTCRRCAATATEVHHTIPVASGGAMFDPGNVVAVCRRCHRAIHDPRTPAQLAWDTYVAEVFK